MKIQVPEHVNFIINTLMSAGYEAYAVGGCVRDSILGRTPGDWDITTSAKPEEVKALFRRTIDTGIEHGTVTIMIEKTGYEVTTYRIDGEYEDNRHPKNVEFTSDLIEDLKRRDFTINAMAYNEEVGIVDAFDGLQDLEKKVIRCVGNATERFDEDALRIMRAVRFAAQLGFTIEEKTKAAIVEKRQFLKNISAERVRVELVKLLTAKHPELLLKAYDLGITDVVLPEFDKMVVTEQTNPHHAYNVGEHSLKAVAAMRELTKGESHMDEKTFMILCLTMLLHDSGKPATRTVDETGRDHFHGHQAVSEKIAKTILKRLKFDNVTIDTVTKLIRHHDDRIAPTPLAVRQETHVVGKELMPLLFYVQKADVLAQNPETQEEKLVKINQVEKLYEELVQQQHCVQLKELAIGGKDLIALGYKPGPILGEVLNHLLQRVIEHPEWNTASTLLSLAKEYQVE